MAPPPQQRAFGLAVGMLVLLALQNLLGIWLNLYVEVHDIASYAGVYPAMFQSVAGILHTVVAILIALNAILMIAATWRLPDRRPRSLAIAEFVLVALTSYFGYHFVQSQGDNAYSFLMETGFIALVLLDAILLILLARHRPDAPPAQPWTHSPS